MHVLHPHVFYLKVSWTYGCLCLFVFENRSEHHNGNAFNAS